MLGQSIDIRTPILIANKGQNKESSTNQPPGVEDTNAEANQPVQENKPKQDGGQNKPADSSTCNADGAKSDITISSKILNSSPGWWSNKEQGYFNLTWVCCPNRTEIFASGLTGDLCKVELDDGLSVVLKYYEEYEIEDEDDDEDKEDAEARRHIDNEVWIYTFLNGSTDSWPSHVPLLHYAGVFLSFRGIIISFIKGHVIKFSQMSREQRGACEIALNELHYHKVLHRDIHYGNFIINSDNKAFIIDFGYSEVCEDEELFEQEKKLLKEKLREGDNSVVQEVREKVNQ
jgi:hypothetical protein